MIQIKALFFSKKEENQEFIGSTTDEHHKSIFLFLTKTAIKQIAFAILPDESKSTLQFTGALSTPSIDENIDVAQNDFPVLSGQTVSTSVNLLCNSLSSH